MAWPPPVFDFTYTNAASQLDAHPNIHNEVNDSLNTDFRPKIDAVSAVADQAILNNQETSDNLALHKNGDNHWLAWNNFAMEQLAMSPSGPITLAPGGIAWYQIRHGMCFAYVSGLLAGTNPTGPATTPFILTLPVQLFGDWGNVFVGSGMVSPSTGAANIDSPCYLMSLPGENKAALRNQSPGGSGEFDPMSSVASSWMFANITYRTDAADT